MRRAGLAAVRTSLVVALAAIGAAPDAAARPRAQSSALSTHENLRQTLKLEKLGPEPGVSIRVTRRMRANLKVLLPDLDPADVTGNTYVGLRIGDWTFERPVAFDPDWRPGRTRANFRVASRDPERSGITTVRAHWSGGVLRISVFSTAEAPHASASESAAAGPLTVPVDGAARLGDRHVHLGGTTTGTVTRTIVPVLDGSVDLARLSLVGHADVVDVLSDSRPPVVAITTPAAVSTVEAGTLRVEGTVRDDRSIASVEWSIDGGAPTNVSFDVVPSSGFLGDLRATFAFSVPATEGLHSVRVVARDAAGNMGATKIDFFGPGSEVAALRTSKWGATCVDAQGRVQFWGYNTTSPTVSPGVSGARAAAGNLALLADGTVTTLHGDPTGASSSSAPFQVQGLSGVADVAQSSTTSASFALRADGTVWAWGNNDYGQLGDGTLASRTTPAQVPGLPAIKAISAGAYHALALDEQGDVWTWGSYIAQSSVASRSARRVPGVANATLISASQFDRYPTGAAILADGTLWMWGDAMSGQLGGSTSARETPAFMVPGVTGARSIAMGYNHALLLLADGTVLARGGPTSQVSGYWGELGDGTSTPNLEFQPVPGLSGVVEVSAGAHTSHALVSDGTIRAWGQNTYGSLGDGTRTDAWSPVVVLLAR